MLTAAWRSAKFILGRIRATTRTWLCAAPPGGATNEDDNEGCLARLLLWLPLVPGARLLSDVVRPPLSSSSPESRWFRRRKEEEWSDADVVVVVERSLCEAVPKPERESDRGAGNIRAEEEDDCIFSLSLAGQASCFLQSKRKIYCCYSALMNCF